VFPPNHVDDLLEVEPNPPDLALAIPEHALEVDNEEEENEPELIFPYVEADPLNPPPPASD
ncbi:hypothetical protein Tco_0447135, partial [Tanacetum coccineum]